VAHVRYIAPALGVNPEQLGLWAFSGGGPFLATSLRERPAWLRAVVAYYAVLDLQQPRSGDASGMSAEWRRTYSAVDALGQNARLPPPIFVARAAVDDPWLNGTIDRFVQKGLTEGATLDVLSHSTGRHSFDILDNDARSKQIIRRTIDFLRDALAP
jgi:dienelactone hydrolase